MLKRFEGEFAAYSGVKHAIGVGNGTDAIWLALMALGIGRAMNASPMPIPSLPQPKQSGSPAQPPSWWIVILRPSASIPQRSKR